MYFCILLFILTTVIKDLQEQLKGEGFILAHTLIAITHHFIMIQLVILCPQHVAEGGHKYKV